MRRLSFLLILLLGASHATNAPAPLPPQEPRPLRVLLLFPTELVLPWALQRAEDTKSAIRATVPRDIDFFAEGLDALRLPGPDHESEFVALLLKRYEAMPPDLIVVHGPMDGFVRRQRAALWPHTPLMAASVLSQVMSNYPADIPGTSVDYDVAGTIDLALRLQPKAKRLVVVSGSSQFNTVELDATKKHLDPYRQRLAIQYLTVGSMDDVGQQLAALPRDSIVFQLPIFRDANGAFRVPREVAGQLAAAANAPSYTYYDAGMGMGFVGGSMANWSGQKPMIGRIARELLLGETRNESLFMHPPVPSVCSVDWRKMKYWHLPLDQLPGDCQVQFRAIGFWDRYRKEAIAVGIVLLIQTALIIALILQRNRRQLAELESSHQRLQLAHASRLATVGELSASIAHEINQPLAAILNNAEAGESLIRSGSANMKDMGEILAAIRDDDMRASDVIQRMRRLLRNEPNDARPLDINEAITSILRLTSGLARRNVISLHTDLDRSIPPIKGDFVQIQQVLLNLVVNAVDAMAELPPERRQLTLSTVERPAGHVEVCVRDSGPGIAAEKLSRIFEPFFSTKPDGMGLGLSITRSIVHAHHGSIWAESSDAGAAIRFSIPGFSIPA